MVHSRVFKKMWLFATAVNPNKLENNKKLQSYLMTFIATNMAANATEQASCMLKTIFMT
jgi:hypothetical protein